MFCRIDDFCIEINNLLDKNTLEDGSGIKRRRELLNCLKVKLLQ